MTDEEKKQRVFRVIHNKENPYFMMVRATAQDVKLTYQALGLLVYLLSKPDDWRVSITDITKRQKCSRNTAYNLLNELMDAGYIQRSEEQVHGKGGKMLGYEYHIYEAPCTKKPDKVKPDMVKRTQHSREVEQNTETTSGASAPTVAHEGQSDGVRQDDGHLSYERVPTKPLQSFKVKAHINEVRYVTASKPLDDDTTPDAGKATPGNGATAEPVPEQKPRARNPIWDSLCAKVFELDPFTLDPKDTAAGRLKTLNGWCSRNNVTGEELARFYVWYGEKYPDIALPRTATKFGEHFLKFRQAGSDAGKTILQRSTGAAT